MANTDNTNRNPELREALVARKCSYKEFMSYQPFNFKGSEGAVGLICWFERTESLFSGSNCTEDCKVKFATGTLIKEALSWWNSFAQPIVIEEAYKITWVEFKKLLIKKDDQMFTTVKLVSRHQNIQQFCVMLHVELTNEDIRNSEAYKEYYAVASRAAPPKTKASVRKTKSSSDTTITPPTAAGTRLLTFAKGKQPAKASKAKSLTVLSEVAMTEAEQIKLATKRSLQQTYISQASGSGADEGTSIIPGVLDVPTEESDEEIS
nr:reverse transcriptase domain-containing protein [Tanacetum cinerariifolium]